MISILSAEWNVKFPIRSGRHVCALVDGATIRKHSFRWNENYRSQTRPRPGLGWAGIVNLMFAKVVATICEKNVNQQFEYDGECRNEFRVAVSNRNRRTDNGNRSRCSMKEGNTSGRDSDSYLDLHAHAIQWNGAHLHCVLVSSAMDSLT